MRILVVDVSTPKPDRDSGSLRAFNLIRLLLDQGHGVDFLPDDGADAGAYTVALRAMGVAVQTGPDAGTYRWFRRHLAGYDALVVSRYHLAESLVPLARAVAPRLKIVLDTVDLHFLREEREAQVRRDRTLARLSRTTRRRELAAIAAADTAWVVSDAERRLLHDIAPATTVHVLPNIVERSPTVAPPEARSGLLFVGGTRHPPNIDAIEWMIDAILPVVHARLPGCVLHVVGEGTRELVGSRASSLILGHGHVTDLSPLLAGCRVGLAPLRFGAGVKGKVNQYMAHGLPAVLTQCAAEGMHLRAGHDALVVDGADAIADAIVRVCEDDDLWRSLSQEGLENVRRHFSADAALTALAATFAQVR